MSTEIDGVNGIFKIEDAGTGAGAKLNLTSTDTSGASGEFLGIINFVSSDSSTGSAGTQAAIKGVYEDNGDSSGLEFFTGNSTGSGTPTLQKRMQIFHDSGVTITTADNTDTLTLISTDADANVGPVLNLYRNSSSPADDDDAGRIHFTSNDSGGNATTYATIRTVVGDVTDGTEDIQVLHQQVIAGTNVNTMRIKPDEIVLNDSSIDLDFRVESNDDANMLFVDGGNNAVGIATNSPVLASGRGLVVHGGASIARVELRNNDSGSAATDGGFLTFGGNQDLFLGNRENATVQFWNNAAERMRIDSAGKVGIGAAINLSLGDSDNSIFQVGGTTHNVYAAHFFHTGDVSNNAPYGIQITYTGGSPDSNSDTANQFIRCNDTTTARFSVAGDGDVTNHDNSYGQISDERIKQNITDASSQWNDIKAIKVRKFERKDDVIQHGAGERIQIGVVAQELETAGMNGLVNHSEPEAEHIKMSSEFGTLYTSDDAETKDGNDAVLYVADDQEVIDGNAEIGDIKTEATHSKKVGEVKTTTDEKVRSVKYSVLYMKAIKALQEAQTRIETLETKVAALEG